MFLKEFDFDDSFQYHFQLFTAKMNQDFQTNYSRRIDEYDQSSIQDIILNHVAEMCLNVTKSVLKEYHQYLISVLPDRSST